MVKLVALNFTACWEQELNKWNSPAHPGGGTPFPSPYALQIHWSLRCWCREDAEWSLKTHVLFYLQLHCIWRATPRLLLGPCRAWYTQQLRNLSCPSWAGHLMTSIAIGDHIVSGPSPVRKLLQTGSSGSRYWKELCRRKVYNEVITCDIKGQEAGLGRENCQTMLI